MRKSLLNIIHISIVMLVVAIVLGFGEMFHLSVADSWLLAYAYIMVFMVTKAFTQHIVLQRRASLEAGK